MKKILIEWKHFDKNGATCTRCSQTGSNLGEAISELHKEFLSQGIQIKFKETKLPEKQMAESNQILLDGILLENFIPQAKAGENHCGSCSDLIDNPQGCCCRTVDVGDDINEEIPVNLIKQAVINAVHSKEEKI